ncbi:hypothetical protein HDV63DRAFT_372966, partial [Trichoderma sp. SZMC 28014]
MGKAVVSKSGLATARINGTVIAEANSWWETEGNIYFPPESIKAEYFTGTSENSWCPWKGEASYYTINAGGEFAASTWSYNWILTMVD